MAYWLVKSDPDTYGWEDFEKEKSTPWDGVRNYQARNNLREMKTGDKVLFYHSVTGKSVVGVATVGEEAFQDPTTDDERWVAVELKIGEKFAREVSLDAIKNEKTLENIALIKQSRLSVMPLTEQEHDRIIEMSADA